MPTSTDDKSLDRFLEVIHNNQPANRARFPAQYHIIQRIDDCFVTAGKHLSHQKPVLVGPMFLRSQYAYKTAAGMTLAGQVAESFVMMRSCLEYAGYALAIFADPCLQNTPSREEVFVNRNVLDAHLDRREAERGAALCALRGAVPKARFGSGAVSGSVDAGMRLHREANPNVGAAFNIATHSQPVVLTPQTAHFGRQVQLPLA